MLDLSSLYTNSVTLVIGSKPLSFRGQYRFDWYHTIICNHAFRELYVTFTQLCNIRLARITKIKQSYLAKQVQSQWTAIRSL